MTTSFNNNSLPVMDTSILQYTPPPLQESAGSSFVGELYTDTGPNESEWLSGVWDWATSSQGASVMGGAVSAAGDLLASEQLADMTDESSTSALEIAQMNIDAEMAMQEKALAQQMEIAMLEENRIKKHNSSINQTYEMPVRKYK